MLDNKLTYNVGCLRHVCAKVKSWDTVVLRFQNDAALSSFDPLLSAFFNIFFLSPPFFYWTVLLQFQVAAGYQYHWEQFKL